jgi:hypothetical protein
MLNQKQMKILMVVNLNKSSDPHLYNTMIQKRIKPTWTKVKLFLLIMDVIARLKISTHSKMTSSYKDIIMSKRIRFKICVLYVIKFMTMTK